MVLSVLKGYMPRGLYGRAALILLLPVITVQLVVAIVFVQRHFEDVTGQMAANIAPEIEFMIGMSERGRADSEPLTQLFDITSDLISPEEVQTGHRRDWIDFTGLFFIAHISQLVPSISHIDLTQDDLVVLQIQADENALELTFDRSRATPKNAHQLLVNMVFFGLLISVIAFIYLRNQLRPIKRLARAASAFGRGQSVQYTPAGAIEVRAAGAAFLDMRTRIERQIETRTLMLSGISHDLRTPLTRMRLAISLLDDADRKELEADVDEMQRMVNAFLDFASTGSAGKMETVDPIQLVRDFVDAAQKHNEPVQLFDTSGAGEVRLRPLAIRRALDNLVGNALRYAGSAELSVTLSDRFLRFRVEDAGPGIPDDLYEEALKPFSRLDPARNQDSGSGVGLGLAIATDIARAHGGSLRLSRSERLGGLQVDLVLSR